MRIASATISRLHIEVLSKVYGHDVQHGRPVLQEGVIALQVEVEEAMLSAGREQTRALTSTTFLQ